MSRYLLTSAFFVSSDGAAGEDLRGLDSSLRRRAPVCSLQHQSQNVRALFCFTIRTTPDAIHFLTHRIYDLTLLTYFFAFAHFGSELLIFRTASFGPGALSPVVVSSEWTVIDASSKNPDPLRPRDHRGSRILNLDDHAIRLLRAVEPAPWEPAPVTGVIWG